MLLSTLAFLASTALPPQSASVCGNVWTANSISAARSAKGHALVLQDGSGIRLAEWNNATRSWSDWSIPSGQASIVSDAWIQTHVSGINNIFALSRQSGTQRIEQWLRYGDGSIVKSIGIDEADSVVFRPVCGHKGPRGEQALFAVFRDSTIRTRVWDSLERTWSGWSQMGHKTGRPLSLNQVQPNMFNLFSLSGETVWQNWWTGSGYNGWVVPAVDGTGNDPISVNLNYDDHFLFSFAPNGQVQSRFWNGSYWTGWSPLELPATHSLAAVAISNDSLLLYGLDSRNQVLQAGWNRTRGWSPAQQLGMCAPRRRAIDSRRLTAASTTKGILLAIRGWNDSIYHALVPSSRAGGTCWNPLSGQPRTLSNPWLQARVGDINNLMVLGEAAGVPRTFQWIFQHGTFQPTNGIGESDSIVSLSSARLDSNGNQALFAVFQDSSIRMRIWDSLAFTWGGWVPLRNNTPHSLGVVQTASSQLNLYSTAANGDIDLIWRHDASWSSWVKPSTDSIISGPTSANFDSLNHVLFGIGPDSSLLERRWNGFSWTGWSKLPWSPLSEPAALVDSSILHLFFVGKDSSIVHIQRTLSGAWSSAENIGPVPPLDRCSIGTSMAGTAPSIRPLQFRNGASRDPLWISYAGPVDLVSPLGRRIRFAKASGESTLPSSAPSHGFLKTPAFSTRYLILR